MGVFHGEGGGLLIAGSYGTIINALLFYGNANNYLKQFQQHHDAGKYLLHLLGAFTLLTALESALDLLVYHLLNIGNITSEVTEEIVWSNLLTHSIFFIVPSFLYRFTVDWLKPKEQNTKPINQLPTLPVKSGSTIHQIPLEELRLIESDGNYVHYHHSGEKIMVRNSLSKVLEKLPEEQFLRCHKSFIVSKKHVTKLDYDFIYLGKETIPIGRVYRKNVSEAFQSS